MKIATPSTGHILISIFLFFSTLDLFLPSFAQKCKVIYEQDSMSHAKCITSLQPPIHSQRTATTPGTSFPTLFGKCVGFWTPHIELINMEGTVRPWAYTLYSLSEGKIYQEVASPLTFSDMWYRPFRLKSCRTAVLTTNWIVPKSTYHTFQVTHKQWSVYSQLVQFPNLIVLGCF